MNNECTENVPNVLLRRSENQTSLETKLTTLTKNITCNNHQAPEVKTTRKIIENREAEVNLEVNTRREEIEKTVKDMEIKIKETFVGDITRKEKNRGQISSEYNSIYN